MAQVAKLRVWRGDAREGQLRRYDVPWEEGMVVLDVMHVLQATQAAGSGRAAGTARRASAARAAPRSTASRG